MDDSDLIKFDVIIPASGKQTRFKSNIPKAIFPYKDSTILEYNTNLLNSTGKIKKIYILINKEDVDYYKGIQIPNLIVVPVNGGRGSGDSLYQLFNKEDIKLADNLIIMWSDVILNKEFLDGVLLKYRHTVINVPAIAELNPYVAFKTDWRSGTIEKVLFSKHGDDTSGLLYHDMSFFLTPTYNIVSYINRYVKEETYDDFDMLDIFNKYSSLGVIIDTQYPTRSFNTIEELETLLD